MYLNTKQKFFLRKKAKKNSADPDQVAPEGAV